MLQKLNFKPGFNKQATESGAEGQWTDGDFVRFRYGLPEKIGGWNQLTAAQETLPGPARAQHAFTSLSGERYTAIGTSKGLFLFYGDAWFDITPLDTRFFYCETDSQGLIWGAADIYRSKAQILREYGIVIRGSGATITDFWDDEVNQIFVANQLYKGGSETQDPTKHPERPEKHGLGYPPLIFTGSGAGLNSLFDSGILKHQFESVFANNRGLIPELHRLRI